MNEGSSDASGLSFSCAPGKHTRKSGISRFGGQAACEGFIVCTTATLVDRVLVLENGTVVEQGTHEELIHNSSSRYARLWAAQTSWYE